MTTPNRIVLISRGRHEEYVTAADMYPGQLAMIGSAGTILQHNVAGGDARPIMVVKEPALRGGIITSKIPSGEPAPLQVAAKGDLLLFLLAIGENVARGVKLMSDGLGSLKAYPATAAGNKLYEITAPSSTITNTVTETVFSNGSYTIPASFLIVGDVLHIRAKAFCIAENSTNTHRVKMYIGATAIGDSGALQLAANDVVIIDTTLTIRTITASGTFIADGLITYSVSGTFSTLPFTVASTAIDCTATQAIAVKSTASAASAGNQIRLDEMEITLDRAALSGETALVQAEEAINNSAGSAAAFIRGLVL